MLEQRYFNIQKSNCSIHTSEFEVFKKGMLNEECEVLNVEV